ncbi:MAG: hypothetical protein L6R39_007607, partial [Caloplaca ligustica]
MFEPMEMVTDGFKILGAANKFEGISPVWPPSINMPDRSSASRRTLPVFTSSYGFPTRPTTFVPEMDARTVRLSEKVSQHGHQPSPALQDPFSDETYRFIVPPSTSKLGPQSPAHGIACQANLRQLDAQIAKLKASLDRDLYGHAPTLPQRTLSAGIRESPDHMEEDTIELGEIIDDYLLATVEQQPGQKGNKREAEDEPANPAKRARSTTRPVFDMMSSQPGPGKKYYSGPYLERTHWMRQESYMPLKQLGTGGQGTAHLVKNRRTGSVVVCKVIPHDQPYRYVYSELCFLRDVLPRHPRIINLRSALVSPTQTQLYLDYCNGGDLASFIEKYHYGLSNAHIPESFTWHAFLQLTEALAFIHRGYDRTAFPGSQFPNTWLPVVHRDIKPGNILLQRARFDPDHPGLEPYPRLVLADFGLAMRATEFN